MRQKRKKEKSSFSSLIVSSPQICYSSQVIWLESPTYGSNITVDTAGSESYGAVGVGGVFQLDIFIISLALAGFSIPTKHAASH